MYVKRNDECMGTKNEKIRFMAVLSDYRSDII